MFEVRTCPSCDDLLAPGLTRCAACSRPDPERADPWNSGTPAAVQAVSSPVDAPAPGSLLAAGPARHRRPRSRLPSLALMLVIALAAALLIDRSGLVVDLQPLLDLFDPLGN